MLRENAVEKALQRELLFATEMVVEKTVEIFGRQWKEMENISYLRTHSVKEQH